MKRIGLIAFAIIMALGVLGVGYAQWSQTLHIGATVSSASINVVFTVIQDPQEPPINGTATSSLPPPNNAAYLLVTNAYPGYGCTYQITAQNLSSVPVSATLSMTSGDPAVFQVIPEFVVLGPNGDPSSGHIYTVNIYVSDIAPEGQLSATFEIAIAPAT